MSASWADPGSYEAMMGRWSRELAEIFLGFAGLPAAGERVLDLGCGTGSLSFAMASQCPEAAIVGIDPAEPAVLFARARRPNPGRLSFDVGDARALPYPNGAFDRVYSLLVLNFIPDADAALREIRRMTRVGATAAAAIWDFSGGLPAWRLFWDTAAAEPAAAQARDNLLSGRFTHPGELGAAWRGLGFKEVVETELRIRMRFSDFADYWQPFLGGVGSIGAYLAGLSDARRRDLAEKVRNAYLSGRPDGPRSFIATAWAVRGLG